jgi:nitrogen regulatory protein P-II 1
LSSKAMTEVEAIVRREKVPDIDKALRTLGVSGVTMTEARGRGRDKLIVTSYVRGKWTFSTDVIHRVVMSVVVDEADVQKVIDTIIKTASTKSVGDGKIFVHPIERAIDISTGEDDHHSLNPSRADKKK